MGFLAGLRGFLKFLDVFSTKPGFGYGSNPKIVFQRCLSLLLSFLSEI